MHFSYHYLAIQSIQPPLRPSLTAVGLRRPQCIIGGFDAFAHPAPPGPVSMRHATPRTPTTAVFARGYQEEPRPCFLTDHQQLRFETAPKPLCRTFNRMKKNGSDGTGTTNGDHGDQEPITVEPRKSLDLPDWFPIIASTPCIRLSPQRWLALSQASYRQKVGEPSGALLKASCFRRERRMAPACSP